MAALLTPTGTMNGKAGGEPKEKKLGRTLLRQYRAADAIAHQGYAIDNNPPVTAADIKGGLNGIKDPDFRIEGVIFDCYNPDPAVFHREQVRWDHLPLVEPTSQDPWDLWDKVDESFGNQIETQTKTSVIDAARSHINQKLRDGQAFNIVIVLTDICNIVGADELARLLLVTRKLDRLERLFMVWPRSGTTPKTAKAYKETLTRQVKISHNTSEKFSIPYSYDIYEADQLEVRQYAVDAAKGAPTLMSQ